MKIFLFFSFLLLAPPTRAEELHHITPADIDRQQGQYQTEDASHTADIVPRPSALLPTAPAGFTVTLIASGLDEPRALRSAPNGDIFLAESGAGAIRVLRLDSEGKAQITKFATRLDRPFGMAFYPVRNPHYLYVAEEGRILRYPYEEGDIVARGAPETIIDNLPTGGHWTRDLAIAPDETHLVYSIGSESNIATEMPIKSQAEIAQYQQQHGLGASWASEAGRAQVVIFDPDGKNARPFATGLRNCAGLARQPSANALWCVVNERDGLGADLPPDYATHLVQNAFYGWPWFYIGNHRDARIKGAPDIGKHVTVPDVLLEAHGAPLGIAFAEGEQFPEPYRGDAFVALHGSWNRGALSGYKIVRLRMDQGRPTGEYMDFLTGFILDNNHVWGRPVGVTVARDGALIVSEDGNGTVWRISRS
ncbi:MAG TPA: PQQ-dependent sugar dehydrogenase [Dongiaceae bacterium]|jgi:glucose/arabinose dehydrogenase|nr:PQQ-dependent sugar dehydrogenase [Dongiaceae bacterium]